VETSLIPAIFIDRDGTIGGSDEVIHPGDFALFPFTSRAIDRLKKQGLRLFGFTNQPGAAI
jgi:histidinol phosphatase-like enzyme